MKKVKFLFYHSGQEPVVKIMEPNFEALQKEIGGEQPAYVETKRFGDIVALFDEDGRLKRRPPCLDVMGFTLVGTVVFARLKDGEVASLTDDDLAWIQKNVDQWTPEEIETGLSRL